MWDDKGRTPSLQTDADWIRAGELVFDAPLVLNTTIDVGDVRDERWQPTTGAPVAGDGTLPWVQYVIRKKGVVELGSTSCGFCHTRIMPDGSKLKGAQGNLQIQRAVAFRWHTATAAAARTRTSPRRRLAPFSSVCTRRRTSEPDPQDKNRDDVHRGTRFAVRIPTPRACRFDSAEIRSCRSKCRT